MRTLSRRCGILLVGITAFLALPGIWASAQEDVSEDLTWGVVPSSENGPDGRSAFEYLLDSGDEITDYFGVVNYTHRDLEFAVYASDAFTTSVGGFDLLPADTDPSGVGAWIAFGVETVVVPARSRSDIPFRLEVPHNATPGDHAGGVVASVRTGEQSLEGTVQVDRRVGARVYLRVSGELDPNLAIQGLAAEYQPAGTPFASGRLALQYTVHNQGNVRLAGPAKLTVSGVFGDTDYELDPLPDLLPGDSLHFAAGIEGVAPMGPLEVTVEIELQAPGLEAIEPVIASVRIWALSFSTLGLLALVVLSCIGYLWRHRRHKAGAEP